MGVVVVVLVFLGFDLVVDIMGVEVVVLERLGLGLCGLFLLTDDLNTEPAKVAAELPHEEGGGGGGGGAGAA